MPLAAIAFEAFTAHNLPDGLEPNLEAQVTYDPPNFSWPFGTHMCAVEVDTETGHVDVLKYVAVDDCGVQVNPMIVDGQVHGGVVQGIAQALCEEAVYDTDGNLKTSTLAEYLVPAASDVPSDHHRPHRAHRHPPTNSASRASARPARSAPHRRSSTPSSTHCPDSACTTCRCPPARTTSGTQSTQLAPISQWRLAVIPAAFDYVRAGSAEEAISLVGQHGEDAKFLAGGHSLLPLMKLRLAQPSVLDRHRADQRPVVHP